MVLMSFTKQFQTLSPEWYENPFHKYWLIIDLKDKIIKPAKQHLFHNWWFFVCLSEGIETNLSQIETNYAYARIWHLNGSTYRWQMAHRAFKVKVAE